MNSSRFDELTKALATATSRRQALKAIATTALGSVLGLGGSSVALANNSACAHFCASVFGADTPAAGQCTSDAAHRKGLCYTCGPASPGGTQAICCSKNGSGYCTSYSSATCCASGQTCQNGQCVTPTTTTTPAPTTTTTPAPTTTTTPTPTTTTTTSTTTTTTTPPPCVMLSNGSCATPCTGTSCPGCFSCFYDNDGSNKYCQGVGGSALGCTSDSDCPRGEFCAASGLCEALCTPS